MKKYNEIYRAQVAIGFGFAFASHWLKNWRATFKPTTKRVISFDTVI